MATEIQVELVSRHIMPIDWNNPPSVELLRASFRSWSRTSSAWSSSLVTEVNSAYDAVKRALQRSPQRSPQRTQGLETLPLLLGVSTVVAITLDRLFV